MSNIYVIYCFINKMNNKKYIGQSKNIVKRCSPSNYKGCTKFYSAIQKYGWDNFYQIILEANLSLEEANKKEEYYIKKYSTIETGYNLKSGGLNHTYSQESKDKMSKSCATKQPIICIETGKIYESAKAAAKDVNGFDTNIISCCRGKVSSAYKFHWKYVNENKNKNFPTKENKSKKKVKCKELNRIFNSMSEASKETGVARPNISHCCAGRLLSAGGYTWEYVKGE